MSVSTSLTKHAAKRVVARTLLTEREILQILEEDKSILLEESRGKIYRLFFSIPDVMCFIAVEDKSTKEVITILSIDYYRYQVSDDAQSAAKYLALPDSKPRKNSIQVGVKRPYEVICYIRSEDGVKISRLGKWPEKPDRKEILDKMNEKTFNGRCERIIMKCDKHFLEEVQF